MIHRMLVLAFLGAAVALPMTALGGMPLPPAAAGLLHDYQIDLRQQNPNFGGFDAARGRALFYSEHQAQGSEKRSCTTCHMQDPTLQGRSDVGKSIAPLAPTANAERFKNAEETEKWFRRNCRWVLGRPCTTQEKGDFITFLFSLP